MAGPGPSRSNGSVPVTASSTASLAENPLDQPGHGRGRPFDPVGPDRADVRDGEAQVAQQFERALCLGVGYAGLGHDAHDRAGIVEPSLARSIVYVSTTGSTSTCRAARSSSVREISPSIRKPRQVWRDHGPGRPDSTAWAASRSPSESA